MTRRWRMLWLLSAAELLAMTLWFSATAVVPQLSAQLALDEARAAWLTMSVQLYAMWTWAPLALLLSYERAGWSPAAARVAGFAVIAAGGLGSVAAGRLADRLGRTTVASASLAVSGACCLAAGALMGSPLLLTALCLGASPSWPTARSSARPSASCPTPARSAPH